MVCCIVNQMFIWIWHFYLSIESFPGTRDRQVLMFDSVRSILVGYMLVVCILEDICILVGCMLPFEID